MDWVFGYKLGLDEPESNRHTPAIPESKTWDISDLGEECATKSRKKRFYQKVKIIKNRGEIINQIKSTAVNYWKREWPTN